MNNEPRVYRLIVIFSVVVQEKTTFLLLHPTVFADNIFVHERKLSQDNGRAEEDGPNIIPLEVQPIKVSSFLSIH